jgi:hypothetical protein
MESELRIRRRTGNRARILQIKWRALYTSRGRCKNQKIRARLASARTNGNGPESTSSGTDERVKVVIVLEQQRVSICAKFRRSRMFPDLRLDLIEGLRKSGVDLWVLPESFNDRQYWINLRNNS